jgi:hypothetical protein
MEVVCFPEISADFTDYTALNPEDRTVHNYPCENLKILCDLFRICCKNF